MSLEAEIESLWADYRDGAIDADSADADDLDTLDSFLTGLEAGEIRAAEKDGSAHTDWEANEWVKEGILLNFGLREIEAHTYGGVDYHDVLPLRETGDLPGRGTRNTPDGTVVRRVPDDRVRLATQAHSLARFSKRTTEHRLPEVPTADSRPGRFPRDLSCPVARSPPDFRPYCTSLLRVLCSVRSRYLFAIGLGECLALAVDACHLRKGFPTLATPELTHTVPTAVTGLSPCLALRSRRLHGGSRALIVSPHTTLPARSTTS